MVERSTGRSFGGMWRRPAVVVAELASAEADFMAADVESGLLSGFFDHGIFRNRS